MEFGRQSDLTTIELTLERSEHIAEWVRLTEQKTQPAQLAQVNNKGGRVPGGSPKRAA